VHLADGSLRSVEQLRQLVAFGDRRFGARIGILLETIRFVPRRLDCRELGFERCQRRRRALPFDVDGGGKGFAMVVEPFAQRGGGILAGADRLLARLRRFVTGARQLFAASDSVEAARSSSISDSRDAWTSCLSCAIASRSDSRRARTRTVRRTSPDGLVSATSCFPGSPCTRRSRSQLPRADA
jgi:hypothetical protein